MAGLAERLARTSLRLRGYSSRLLATSVGRVHVLDVQGEGRLPPLVLLHGLSSAGVHFLPMLGLLRRSVSRLIIPDLPGHGFSDTPSRFDAQSLQQGLFEALDALTPQPSLLFGNSLGGYGAIRYALARPERVKALLLASPGGAQLSEAEVTQLRARFRLGNHGEALEFIDAVLAKPSPLRHAYAWGLRRQLRRPEVEAVLQAISADQLLTAADLRSLTPPLLLLWGQADRILPSSNLAFFREHLPAHAQIHEPPGWGHSPFLDDAPALARRMLQFAHDLQMQP